MLGAPNRLGQRDRATVELRRVLVAPRGRVGLGQRVQSIGVLDVLGAEYRPADPDSLLELGDRLVGAARGFADGVALEGGNEGTSSFLGDFAGDFNGDGMPDLVFNRRIPTGDMDAGPLNRIRVLTGNATLHGANPGSMPLNNVFENHLGKGDIDGAPTGTWDDDYRALAGDVNQDGIDDLVWVTTISGSAHVQVVLGSPEGLADAGLVASDEVFAPEDGPSGVDVHLADVGGSDAADLILNLRDGAVNRVFVGLSRGDGTFDFVAAPQDVGDPEAWSQFDAKVGNFGGSAKYDLAWVSATDSTRVWLAIAR